MGASLLSQSATLRVRPRDPQYDPSGAASAVQTYAVNDSAQKVLDHAKAPDPHKDREWASGQFVPLSYFDPSGQLASSRIPSLAVTDVFAASSEAQQRALSAQRGDICVRTDQSQTYVLRTDDPTVFNNWIKLDAAGQVISVNGQQGVIVLTAADVGAAPLTHAARHRPGGEDDLSPQYMAWYTLGQNGGPAAYSDPRITGAEQTTNKSLPGATRPNGYAGVDSNGFVPLGLLYSAATTYQGVVRLAGDLAGTGNSPTVPGLATKAPLFTPNPTIYTGATNPHTPVQGEIAQYNANAAPITQVLPAAPTGTTVTVLEIKNLTPTTSTNTITFTPAGTDTIEYLSNNPLVLRIYNEARRLVGYQGNWTVQSGLNSLSGLDTRYLQIANHRPIPAGGTTGQVLAKTGAADYAVGWVAQTGGSGTATVPLVPNPPVDQPFATSLTPNAAAGNYRTMTATADFTLNPPTSPSDGQRWHLRWAASAAQRTMTFGAGFRLPVVNGAVMTNTLIVPSGRRGDVAAIYDANDNAWTVLSAQAQAA